MVDWEEARGLWEAWLGEMGVDGTEWRSYSGAGWKPGASAEVARGTSRIAWAGALAQAWLREWGVEVPASQPVHLFVAVLGDAMPESTAPARVAIPGRFPPARRDVAYFVPEHVTHDELVRSLRGAGGEWLQSIELFDVYAGPGTPAGMKSLAFALQFQHPERTLEEAEVAGVQDRMTAAVAKGCGGRLREK
jgi:phenylalanyl-tRNA synthetase beta chain